MRRDARLPGRHVLLHRRRHRGDAAETGKGEAVSDLDDKLRRFLDDHEEARDKGVTLEKVYDAQRRLSDDLSSHLEEDNRSFQELHEHRASMDRRLVRVETKVEGLEESAETTGEHSVEAIREAAEAKGLATAKVHPLRRAHDHPWWRRALDTTVAKVVLLAATGVVGWLLRHLAGHP